MASMERSLFAIYICEDPEGNVYVRADSYGPSEKTLELGFSLLQWINYQHDKDIGCYLPIDRCERVQ